ncbi:MAG: NAD-dependent epimerase/dehydratase family protein [Desulfuromonadaceae bacterium]|nr:NAD-dependent epimerase/dehydratase family protein [Desulfuromonadaceae bacterium]
MDNRLISIIEDDANRILADAPLDGVAGKSVLLTGASGLIGTYILATLREFSRRNPIPICVTALVQSEPTNSFKAFLDFEGAKIIIGDITNTCFVQKLNKFDFIIHAAGYGQPGRFMEDPVKTININTSVTMALFEKLNISGRFLFLSSSEIYSGLPAPPYQETQIGVTNTTHPRSCYIEGKRCGEAICNAFRNRGVNASSARVSLAYGPGTKPHDCRVLNKFIERGITQNKITLQDSGSAKRTYCYVSDTVEILFHILLRGKEPIYNVGGFSRTTIAELAQKVGAYLGKPVQFPDISQELGGAPDDVFLDMSLVERDFKKIKYMPFDKGLEQTIEWQKALYSL